MCKSKSLVLLSLVFLSTHTASATTLPARVVSASFFDIQDPNSGPMHSTSYAGVPPSQYTVPTNIHVLNWNNLPLQFGSVPGSTLDLVELLDWQVNYDAYSPVMAHSVAAGSVPEPTTIWLGMTAASIAVSTARRKRLS